MRVLTSQNKRFGFQLMSVKFLYTEKRLSFRDTTNLLSLKPSSKNFKILTRKHF